MDIRELSGMTREKAEDSEFMMEFVSKFGHVGKPIIAAVNGLAVSDWCFQSIAFLEVFWLRILMRW